MAEQFDSAAIRHWADGTALESLGRVANADQLVGIAAECALKVALLRLPLHRNGELGRQFRAHVNELWDRIPLQGIENYAPGLVPILRNTTNPFDDWDVAQRYGDDLVGTSAALERHKKTARRLLGSVQLLGSRRDD